MNWWCSEARQRGAMGHRLEQILRSFKVSFAPPRCPAVALLNWPRRTQRRFHTDVHSCAWDGDVEALRRLLDAHPDWVDSRDETEFGGGWQPLHCAAYNGQRAAVEALVRVAFRRHREQAACLCTGALTFLLCSLSSEQTQTLAQVCVGAALCWMRCCPVTARVPWRAAGRLHAAVFCSPARARTNCAAAAAESGRSHYLRAHIRLVTRGCHQRACAARVSRGRRATWVGLPRASLNAPSNLAAFPSLQPQLGPVAHALCAARAQRPSWHGIRCSPVACAWHRPSTRCACTATRLDT